MKNTFDDTILKMLDDNKDLVQLQAEKAKLLPKFCERCNKDLKDYKECRCKDDKVRPNEYQTWTSILPEDIGRLSYICYECAEHYRLLPHYPDTSCYECSKLKKQKKLKN